MYQRLGSPRTEARLPLLLEVTDVEARYQLALGAATAERERDAARARWSERGASEAMRRALGVLGAAY